MSSDRHSARASTEAPVVSAVMCEPLERRSLLAVTFTAGAYAQPQTEQT
jgi:hypothetical protein